MTDVFDYPPLKALLARLAVQYPYEQYTGRGPSPRSLILFSDAIYPRWRETLAAAKLAVKRKDTGFHLLEGLLAQRSSNMWMHIGYQHHPLGPRPPADRVLCALALHWRDHPPGEEPMDMRQVTEVYTRLALPWSDLGTQQHLGYVYLARNAALPDTHFKVGKSGARAGRGLDEYRLMKIFLPVPPTQPADVERAVLTYFRTHAEPVAVRTSCDRTDRFAVRSAYKAVKFFREALEERGWLSGRRAKSTAYPLAPRALER